MTNKKIVSLRIKLGVTALMISFFSVMALTWQGVKLTQDRLIEANAISIAELLPILQSALVAPLLEEDVATLEEILLPITRASGGDISALQITNRNGDILWSLNSGRLDQRKTGTTPPLQKYQPQQFLDYLAKAENGGGFQTTVPLLLAGNSVGKLTLLFDTRRIDDSLSQVTRSGIIFGSLAATLGGLVFLLIGWALTTHLKKMQQAADAIAGGNYQVALDINSNDELGLLASAFNRMAQQIERHRQQQYEREQHIIFTLNSIADGVVAVDNSGAVSQINPVASSLTGWKTTDALNQPVERIFKFVDHQSEPVVPPVRQALEWGKRVNLAEHAQLVDKEGNRRPVRARATPIINAQGLTVGAIMVFHDHSEEYLHQQQLSRQQEQLTAAEEVANMGSWSRDLHNNKELHWSPGFYRIMEIDPDTLPAFDQVLPRFSAEDRRKITLALEQKQSSTITMKVPVPSGTRRDIQVTFRHFFDNQPEPQRLVGIIRDITKELAAARSSRETEQMLLSVINVAPALVVVKDRDGRILHTNQTHADVLGKTRDEIIGKTSYDIHPAEEADDIVARDQQVFDTGQPLEANLTIPHDDGERNYTATRTPLIDDHGKVYGLVFLAWDVTDQNRQLDQRRGRQKMEALGQLTGGVAHDYNNMLAIILGYAELLEEKVGDHPTAKNYVKEILYAGRRSAEMVKKLLAFSQKKSDDIEITHLNELLENSRDRLEKTLTPAIQLTLDLADQLWPVETGASEFEDALINLVVNAKQAMPDGGTLTVATHNLDLTGRALRKTRLAAGEYVRVSVADSGIGMDSATIERALEPFFTTKGEFGTGLGLSQVYGFVQRARGDIEIISSPGKGSEFRLYFPRSDSQHDHDHAAADESDYAISEQKAPEIGKILLVDDEPALIELSQEILSARGYEVTTSTNAEEALELLGDTTDPTPFDLLMTDIIMPNMDGQRLAELAREQQTSLRVLFVSGYNQATAIKLEPGRTQLLTKPFSASELLTKIRQILDRSG
ncbi:MAG: PAS domain-containing protein [Gammaproteobacteria bacterium]